MESHDFPSDLKAVCDETAGLIIINPPICRWCSRDGFPWKNPIDPLFTYGNMIYCGKEWVNIRCWEMFDSLTNSLETFTDWPYYYILLRDGKDLGSLICFHPINCWFSQRDDSPLWLLLGSKKNPKTSELLSVSHLISEKQMSFNDGDTTMIYIEEKKIYMYIYICVWIDIIQHIYIYNIL